MSEPTDPARPPGYQPYPGYPPYSPPGYAPYPPPGSVPPPPPGRVRRLSLLWVVVGIVAAVGIGLGAGAIAVPSDDDAQPAGTLRIGAAPSSIGRYHRIGGARGERLTARVRQAMTRSNPVSQELYGDALIAVYAFRRNRGPDLLVVANDVDNATVLRLLQTGDPDTRITEFMTGLHASGTQDYPAAPLSGPLRCGAQADLDATICAWFDDSTFGYIADYTDHPAARLADLTVRVRRATEH